MNAKVIRTAFAALVVSGIAAQAVGAQRTAAQGCPAVDTTAPWYRRQIAWGDDARHDWSNDTLRTALLRAAGLDPSRASQPDLGYEIVGDAPVPNEREGAMIAQLRALTRNRQSPWPTRSVVGAAGVRAVWLLTARDSSLAQAALHRMMEAGPEESPPSAVAILEDRLRIRAGRKQLYGTQLVRGANGSLEPAPIEDPKHVDLRRDAAALPPLALSLCLATGATPAPR